MTYNIGDIIGHVGRSGSPIARPQIIGDMMKTIRVAAAIICDSLEHPTKVFATAKGYGEFKGLWEFPGGKLEAGETSLQALIREVREELSVDIEVGELIETVEYDYPKFHLSMDCFFCKITAGELVLKEAADARWLSRDELDSVEWLPADIELISRIKARIV